MSPARVPVLLVESGRGWGGTERVLDTLARGLDRERFVPWVVIPPVPALDGWADDLRRAGIAVERLPEMTHRLQLGRGLVWVRFLRARRHALLHLHHVFPSSDRYLVPLAHLAGVRAVVITEHLAAPPHSRGQRWLKRWELSRADVAVAVSGSVADVLCPAYDFPRELMEVVPNGVSVPPALAPAERAQCRRQWGVPEGARAWLTVARLEDQKGIDVLLEAWAALPEPRPHLVLAGDGSRRAALEARARELGVADRVRFLGAVPDARRLYRAADGFVLASRQEGMPLALLESMAAGLPAVVTAVEGVAEATGGETALVVPPSDPVALAAAVMALERDRARAVELGESAARRARERFGEEHMVDAYEALYRRALRLTDVVAGGRRPDSAAA